MWLTFDLFAGRVGEVFQAAVEDGAPLGLVLSEAVESAQPGGPGPQDQSRLQFALTFTGPPTPLFTQSTFTVSHPEVGTFPLFLVPIAADATCARYQAVFA